MPILYLVVMWQQTLKLGLAGDKPLFPQSLISIRLESKQRVVSLNPQPSAYYSHKLTLRTAYLTTTFPSMSFAAMLSPRLPTKSMTEMSNFEESPERPFALRVT